MRRFLAVAFLLALVSAAFAQSWTTPGPSSGTGYPVGAFPVTSSATGSTGAVVATLPAAVGKTTYLCGAYVTGNTTTTANVTTVTVANTISGSLVFGVAHPVTPALGNSFLPDLTPCIPANALNTAITVTSAADAAGVSVSVTAWGYQF
jgi:hypothetical protein